MKRLLLLFCLPAYVVAAPPTDTLLDNHPLAGSTRTTIWRYINFVNPSYISDNPATMTGTLAVSFPGYGASDGLYSYTGPYSITATQSTADFDIQHAVLQLDLVWDPASTFPVNGGPKLNYNGGNQQLSPKPMIVGRVRQLDNDTGIPEMEHLDSFVYRGITFQWDLSAVEQDIHSVSIVMPVANHTSIVGVRTDVASEYEEINGTSLTALQIWRDTYFDTIANTGNAADHADPDGDGLSNLVEYALGTRPDNTDGEQGAASAPALLLSADRPRLSFKTPSAPPTEITYRVQSSGDLVTWKTVATKTGASAWVWNGDGASQIHTEASIERQPTTIGDDVPSSNTKRFMRLHITR